MKLFLDTNVILELYLSRVNFDAVRAIELSVEQGMHQAVVSEASLSTFVYVAEKHIRKTMLVSAERRAKMLRHLLQHLLTWVDLASAGKDAIALAAADTDFTDIEDSFQYQCALESKCDILVTINKRDFERTDGSRIRVLTPAELAGPLA